MLFCCIVVDISTCCKPSIHEQLAPCSVLYIYTQDMTPMHHFNFNKKISGSSLMEKGESLLYGLFDTMWWTTKIKSTFFSLLDIFIFLFFLSKWAQIFVGCVYHHYLLWKRRVISICVCRLVR